LTMTSAAQSSKAKKKPETLAAPTAAVAAPAAAASVDKAQVKAYLDRVYGYKENLNFEVLEVAPSDAPGVLAASVVANGPKGAQALTIYVTADGQHMLMGEMGPFGADPFSANRARLDKEAFGAVKGSDKPVMTIVEFADMECPGCRSAQSNMHQLEDAYPQVRFIYQNFPLSQMHPWAERAASMMDCIARESNEKAWSFIDTVYVHQPEIPTDAPEEKLSKYADFAGADGKAVLACSVLPETTARVQKSVALGNALKVSGTPALYINGRLTNPMINYDELKAIVDFELAQATKK